ncbi:hypothetical protein [Ruminococcus flavefaciens]|uniref:hypothetical protein n=1 Tax=Ruminococcus flavefaciens TaxID=1265 RepID=UPI003F104D7E
MADEKKGITVKIDADLHAEIKQFIEQNGMTMADFVSQALYNELHPKIQPQEVKNMGPMRTMAFQMPEDMFQRLKDYLHEHNMTQKEFVLGLVEAELNRDQELKNAQAAENLAESTEDFVEKQIAPEEFVEDETEDEDFDEEMDEPEDEEDEELYDDESENEDIDEESDDLEEAEAEDEDFGEEQAEHEEVSAAEETDNEEADEEIEDESFSMAM